MVAGDQNPDHRSRPTTLDPPAPPRWAGESSRGTSSEVTPGDAAAEPGDPQPEAAPPEPGGGEPEPEAEQAEPEPGQAEPEPGGDDRRQRRSCIGRPSVLTR